MEEQTNVNAEGRSEYQISDTITEQITSSQNNIQAYLEKIKAEQNLPLGLIAGFVTAIIGAVIWASITVATEYQIAYMAIGLGFIVGFAVRLAGKGIDKIFGISAAILAIFGCLLGNLLSIIGFAAKAEGLGYFEALSLIDFSLIPTIMIESFNPMDILFYGIAIYAGYKYSFRQITQEEVDAYVPV